MGLAVSSEKETALHEAACNQEKSVFLIVVVAVIYNLTVHRLGG
jgi:hypothetical protein